MPFLILNTSQQHQSDLKFTREDIMRFIGVFKKKKIFKSK